MTVQYSIQKMLSDGTLSTIALGIQYLQRNDIYMRIAGEETPQSGAPSGYTWSFLDATTIRVLPVVPTGITVEVYRRTDITGMYNVFSQNAQFDEGTIDENNQQLLYIAQEYLEQGIPGAGVDTIEFLRYDGINTYYRVKRTDGSYSDEFAVPSAQDKRISVANFGAVGDGVTDDTAAINAALAYAGGKSLYFPSGVYLTNGGHSIPAGCCIYGDGLTSVLKSTSLVDGGVGAGFRLFDARNITGFIVRDLMMDLGGITVFPSAIRCMRIFNCSDYAVHGIKAITPGAFTASMQCHHFRVQDCDIKVQSTDSAVHHDGIIDQWYGSHDFQIIDNTIDGGAIALYPILVTGTDSNNNPTTSYRFIISGNIVSNTNEVGVWVQGRSGTCFDFDVSGNTVDTVTDYYGIAITDSHDFRCRGNQTKNTGLNGIRFSTEGSGTVAAVNGVVDGNIVTNANVNLSVNTGDGSGISVASKCSRLSLTGNVVNGTSHTYAIFLGASTSNIEVLGTNLAVGTLGTIYNTVVYNRIPGGGAYIPTLTLMTNVTAATARLCKWEWSGNNIRVTGRVAITPTVGSSTTTQLGISLPVPSNLQDTNQDLTGSAATAFNLSAAIFSDITNDMAQFQFTAPNTGSHIFFFSFIYTVLP